MLDELSSAVAELMTAACEQLVLPRFRRLSSEEIETKSGPNDLVTVADREAELFLTPRLLGTLALAARILTHCTRNFIDPTTMFQENVGG